MMINISATTTSKNRLTCRSGGVLSYRSFSSKKYDIIHRCRQNVIIYARAVRTYVRIWPHGELILTPVGHVTFDWSGNLFVQSENSCEFRVTQDISKVYTILKKFFVWRKKYGRFREISHLLRVAMALSTTSDDVIFSGKCAAFPARIPIKTGCFIDLQRCKYTKF